MATKPWKCRLFCSVLILTISISVLISTSTLSSSQSNSFQSTTCFALQIEINGLERITCTNSVGSEPRTYASSYPCLQVFVRYFVDDRKTLQTSTLRESVDLISNRCATEKYCSQSLLENSQEVTNYLQAHNGSSFPCFYDAGSKSQVVRVKPPLPEVSLLAYVIPGVFVAISALATILILCRCTKDGKPETQIYVAPSVRPQPPPSTNQNVNISITNAPVIQNSNIHTDNSSTTYQSSKQYSTTTQNDFPEVQSGHRPVQSQYQIPQAQYPNPQHSQSFNPQYQASYLQSQHPPSTFPHPPMHSSLNPSAPMAPSQPSPHAYYPPPAMPEAPPAYSFSSTSPTDYPTKHN